LTPAPEAGVSAILFFIYSTDDFSLKSQSSLKLAGFVNHDAVRGIEPYARSS
jgi:hypothetical protein